jgi:hypothetical protein
VQVLNLEDLREKKVVISNNSYMYHARQKIAEAFDLDIMQFELMIGDK